MVVSGAKERERLWKNGRGCGKTGEAVEKDKNKRELALFHSESYAYDVWQSIAFKNVKVRFAAKKLEERRNFFLVNRSNTVYSGRLRRQSCYDAFPLGGCDAVPEYFLGTDALQC